MTRLSNNHDTKLFNTGLGKGIELLNRLNGFMTADDAQELIESPELIEKWYDGLSSVLMTAYRPVSDNFLRVGPDTYVRLESCECAPCKYNGFMAITIRSKQQTEIVHVGPAEGRVRARGNDGQNVWLRRTEMGGDVIVRVRPDSEKAQRTQYDEYGLTYGILTTIGTDIEATVQGYPHSCYHCSGDEALVVELRINGGNASGDVMWVHLYDGLWQTVKDIQIAPARGVKDGILVRLRKR